MGTWAEVSARAGRNDMPAILVNAFLEHSLPRREMAKGIAAAWTMAEWPTRAADPDVWETLFDSTLGDDEYLRDDKIKDLTDLPETVTLYRGCVAGHEAGMSWTDDLETARWFANRFDDILGEPKVYTVTIPREIVLARFHESRKESEWVIAVTELLEDDIQEVV